MPYDSADLNFHQNDADGDPPSQAKAGGGILAAFTAAKREISSSVKRAGGLAILSAMLVAAAALCAPQRAQAQCYNFTAGSSASLTLNITNLPGYTTHGDGSGGTVYTYTLDGLSGNSVTLIVGSTQYSATAPGSFLIQIDENTTAPYSSFGASAQFGSSPIVVTSASLQNLTADLLPTGLIPVLPPISNWPNLAQLNVTVGSTQYPAYNLTAITPSCAPPPPPKTLGDCMCNGVGDPIDTRTGNLFEQATDYTTAGQNKLAFSRYYNSLALNTGTYAATLGGNWRSTYDRYLHISPPTGQATTVIAERADGQGLTFTWTGSTWVSDSDVDTRLSQAGSTWTLTDRNDTVETYTGDSTGKGTLNSIKARNGYTQTLTDSGGLLQSVTDSYNRSLPFTYSGGLLSTVTTPDGTLNFAFNSNGALSTVTYPTSPATTLTYVYENATLPLGLTGIIDENGNRYATWAYDTMGRATSSKLGGSLGADLTTVVYNANGTTTVTNALGVADTYTFSTLQGVPKVTQISRAATSTTAAATRTFGYDTNGYLNSSTDWDGNHTTHQINSTPSGQQDQTYKRFAEFF